MTQSSTEATLSLPDSAMVALQAAGSLLRPIAESPYVKVITEHRHVRPIIGIIVREAQAAPVAVSLLVVLLMYLFLCRGSASNAGTDRKTNKKKSKINAVDGELDLDALWERLGAPEEPHLEATHIPCQGPVLSNMISTLDNEHCSGKVLSMHKATFSKELEKSGNYRYGTYWLGKKRIWETRVQLQFKTIPTSTEMFFGIALEKYVPMPRSTVRTMETIVSMLKRVVGNQVYHSPGDDINVVQDGELELPTFVMPLWAFDQFIVTPAGERPPDLDDPDLPVMGSKRVKRVKEFRAELDALQFEAGATYTFCFWGISQWLDKINWKVKMPVMGSLDFNMFCGAPPVHVVIYTMPGHNEEREDKRHLESRKNYYMNLAFWSSTNRPEPARVKDIMGSFISTLSLGSPGSDVKSRTKRKTSDPQKSWMTCCSAR
eukprot:TRINITY_DN34970_c0_g1_i1.p1 TRINITY_DN34970_c0_g1~~TRINITY_DN34970_c0_g1_i1.p1  ORF type:complete len:432 (+),score=58.94 TRINITY_DN34970_c0_g1_i1:75-1370(+)